MVVRTVLMTVVTVADLAGGLKKPVRYYVNPVKSGGDGGFLLLAYPDVTAAYTSS